MSPLALIIIIALIATGTFSFALAFILRATVFIGASIVLVIMIAILGNLVLFLIVFPLILLFHNPDKKSDEK